MLNERLSSFGGHHEKILKCKDLKWNHGIIKGPVGQEVVEEEATCFTTG